MVTARARRGFTLIEMLVVVAIIVLITSVVLVNNNRFGGVVLLENLAYDVALSVRQAQQYGISVTGLSNPNFTAGYGMDFNMASPGSYILFADIPQNGVYNGLYNGSYACPQTPTVGSEFVQCSTISQGYGIIKLCVPAGTDAASCNAVSEFEVTFHRPEPDANITIGGTPLVFGPDGHATNGQESARVVLQSPRGDTMSVVIDINGQISVTK